MAKHSSAMKKDSIPGIVAALLILLFSYTAFSKLLEHDKFVFQMRLSHFPLLHYTAGFLAWFLPVLEFAITVLLILPATRLFGLYSSVALLSVFTVYIVVMLLSGRSLPCTCGGIISRLSWKGHLLFNSFFILASVVAIFRTHIQRLSDQYPDTNFSRV